jgi:hypothetical protein
MLQSTYEEIIKRKFLIILTRKHLKKQKIAHLAKFCTSWIKQQIGLKAFLHNMKKTLPFLTQHLPEFPELLHDFLIHQNQQRSLPALPPVLKKKSMWPSYGLGLLIGMIIGGLIVYEFF